MKKPVAGFPHQPVLSRRRFCACCVGSAAFATTGAWLTPSQAFAEARNVVDVIRAEAAKAPIAVHRLRGNVSVLEGSGGNIAVLTGPDGKLMVDAGITASRPRIAQALASLSPDPIKYLINTHWHFDHADGNEWLHGEGATILAHANTRKHLTVAQRVEDWDFNFPSAPSGAIPSEVVADGQIVKLNGSTLALKHYAPAHTDGDISVAFTEADILHTGGSIDGMILATEANLAAANEATIIIPGHGPPVSNRSELKNYRDMLVAIRENVAALKKQGRSLADIIAAKPTAAYDAKQAPFPIEPAFFTRLVYQGI